MARSGVAADSCATHRGFALRLVRHSTGVTVRRTVYNVSISSGDGLPAAYLTNFSSARDALAAARAEVDRALAGESARAT